MNEPHQRPLDEPAEPSPALPRQGSVRWSLTWAFEGIVWALRSQRNMQIHVGAATLALLAGVLVDFSRIEMAVLVGAISMVLVAEMINTAIEATIDAVITGYHPLVKIAKDVAAGAVLVATINALAVAYFMFYEHLSSTTPDLLLGVRRSPTHLVVLVMILTVIAAIALKAYLGRGTPLRGGMPSGHAAAAFAAWMAVTLISEPLRHAALVSMLAFLMALLVAQSRVEAGIHSLPEVMVGAVLGVGVTMLVFKLLG
ncbi:MAG TPA: diacylglycerol kinase [Miltoncostaeaceae bacterium]|nr:diacylglycerol kinase [Miltoncostaeaceae bacterium]